MWYAAGTVSLDAGTKVGRYTIVRLLAQGGMAEVYKAEQELTSGISRPAAVKVIRPEYSESTDFREMFLDEARTACTLSHANIVHIYEVGETEEGQLYMAMELVPGETLATVARTLRAHDERFADEALFAIGIACCSALEAVHALRVEGGTVNLVHRDVSPHNLLLSTTGSLKLIDFGIAKAATNRNLTMPGTTKGKAGYFSPEQAMGKTLDGRSDLFSLGVTLYKLACGATPFDEHTNHGERHAALVRGVWKRLPEVFPGLPQGFYDVVDRAMQLKPEDRYQEAREMREALEKAAFEAGIRVSASSLLGYLDKDGEITASGGSRRSAHPEAQASAPAVSAPSPLPAPGRSVQAAIPTLEIRRVKAPPATKVSSIATTEPFNRRTLLLAIASFVTAVVVGVLGILVLFGPKAEPPRPPPPRVEQAVVVVKPLDETPLPPAVEPRVEPPAPPVKVDPAPVKPRADPRPVPVKLAPDEAPVRPPHKAPEKPEKPVEVAPASIPEGTGKLRIGVSTPSAVASILVNGEDWGPPPANKGVPSGHYTVVVKLADGKRSNAWKGAIYPDRISTLKFDVERGAWEGP